MTGSTEVADRWRTFVALAEPARTERVRAELEGLPAADPPGITRAMGDILTVESSLGDSEQQALTLARLRAWLAMDADTAHQLSECVEAARESLPAPVAMRSIMATQTAIRSLSAPEVQRLIAVAPSVEHEIPAELRETFRGLTKEQTPEPAVAASDSGPRGAEPTGRPFWQIWKR